MTRRPATRWERVAIASALVWTCTYLMLVGFLAIGGIVEGQDFSQFHLGAFMLFIVMAFPTLIVVMIVSLAVWISKGARREQAS